MTICTPLNEGCLNCRIRKTRGYPELSFLQIKKKIKKTLSPVNETNAGDDLQDIVDHIDMATVAFVADTHPYPYHLASQVGWGKFGQRSHFTQTTMIHDSEAHKFKLLTDPVKKVLD